MPLPMIDTTARWVGPLACLADLSGLPETDQARAPLDAAAYIAGENNGEWIPAGTLRVTLRPLSAAEEDACEVEAGPPIALAGFLYRAMMDAGVDLGDAEAVARAVADLPEKDQRALWEHDRRESRLRWARVSRSMTEADFVVDGLSPADTLERVTSPLRGQMIAEIGAHLDRITTLGIEGKVVAGPQ